MNYSNQIEKNMLTFVVPRGCRVCSWRCCGSRGCGSYKMQLHYTCRKMYKNTQCHVTYSWIIYSIVRQLVEDVVGVEAVVATKW